MRGVPRGQQLLRRPLGRDPMPCGLLRFGVGLVLYDLRRRPILGLGRLELHELPRRHLCGIGRRFGMHQLCLGEELVGRSRLYELHELRSGQVLVGG